MVPRCPSCRKEVKPREENPAFPFCSARCRATDLARWFTGSYRVPGPLAEAQPQKRDQEDKE
ncbi:MAG: DNA gyrase inhibitor YacG [Deltaproteobacteria bacterium]|nr:MAG: DNA gyrase inhibitor YacG [Deltaproteobacteria bacterium]